MNMSFMNSINQEKPNCLGQLCTISSVDVNIRECIDCPGFCVNCIKNFCDISNADLAEENYNVIYVASGEVTLFFPYTKTEKQLAANQLILIPHETKFVMRSGNIFAASCVVAHLTGEPTKAVGENTDKPNCVYRKKH